MSFLPELKAALSSLRSRPAAKAVLRAYGARPQGAAEAAMQQQHPQQQWGGGGGSGSRERPWRGGGRHSRSGRGRDVGRPPCLHYARGNCRYGAACRFSHDPQDFAASVALPFQHRPTVVSHASTHASASAGRANSSAAAAASSGLAQIGGSRTAAAAAAPWRFRVMSYNILADCLAHEHAAELYTSAPRFSLEWSYRSNLILREILHYLPDVVCLQEVDHFQEMQQALQPHGYEGIYTKRTGDRRDGLGMFWRTDAVRPVKERIIRFHDLGLKDNVAQLVAFQRRSGTSAGGPANAGEGTSSQTSSEGSASSLAGQKRRQAAQGSSPAPAAAGASGASTGGQHLRFDSSDSEAEAATLAHGGSAKRRAASESGAAASLTALAAVSIEDAVPAGPGSPAAAGPGQGQRRQWVAGEAAVEEATQAADADDAAAERQQQCLPSLVVSNIHVLFNPRRGDLKMGQVRTLLEQVDSLCLQQQKRSGQRAAAVICGDFNSAAGSPIYEFVRTGILELPAHDRRRMSGQVEGGGRNWHALQQAFLERQQRQLDWQQRQLDWQQRQLDWQQRQQQQQQAHGEYGGPGVNGHGAWPGQPPAMSVDSAVAALSAGSNDDSHQHLQHSYSYSQQHQQHRQYQFQHQQQQVVPPYAPPEPEAAIAAGHGSSSGSSSARKQRPWSAEDVRLAAGSKAGSSMDDLAIARHPLQLESAYGTVTGGEAAYSTCHDKFIGCVDYCWYTPGGEGSAPWRLQPLSVVEPPPLQTLHCALPSPAWPSDHIALVCDYVLLPGGAPAQRQGQRAGKAAAAAADAAALAHL